MYRAVKRPMYYFLFVNSNLFEAAVNHLVYNYYQHSKVLFKFFPSF